MAIENLRIYNFEVYFEYEIMPSLFSRTLQGEHHIVAEHERDAVVWILQKYDLADKTLKVVLTVSSSPLDAIIKSESLMGALDHATEHATSS